MTVVGVRMVVIGVRITVTPAVGMNGAGGHGVIVAVDHAGRSLCAGEWGGCCGARRGSVQWCAGRLLCAGGRAGGGAARRSAPRERLLGPVQFRDRPPGDDDVARARNVVDPEGVAPLADFVEHGGVGGTSVDLTLEHVLV